MTHVSMSEVKEVKGCKNMRGYEDLQVPRYCERNPMSLNYSEALKPRHPFSGNRLCINPPSESYIIRPIRGTHI